MSARIAVLLAVLALIPGWARASAAIIYQPQRADMLREEAGWPAVFADAHAQGFDTLVVQWVEYGDAFADPAGRDWLQRRLLEARGAGLKLVLGLGGDPAFFRRQQAPTVSLRGYLRSLAAHDLALARLWRARLGDDAIDGWYLPLEVDDARWRDADARALLVAHLRDETARLRALLPRPVHVTAFFAGNMAPQAYAGLVGDLATAGVRVWVQDGAGTGRLLPGERRLYLDAVQQCPDPAADGVVFELFRQTAHDRVFAAEPLSGRALAEALAQPAGCGGERVFFALRYLQAGLPPPRP